MSDMSIAGPGRRQHHHQAWLSSVHNQTIQAFYSPPLSSELADLTSRVFSDATFRQSSVVGCLAESGRAPHKAHRLRCVMTA